MPNSVTCLDLDEAIDHYTKQLGYRLDMIVPADSPTAAVMSKNGETIRLQSNGQRTTDNGQWQTGRAGMEYRDLIPGRLGGRVIASHIRIPNGGEVADYVHYHKVRFQMIYCLKGSIKVVYEDQGPPFLLKPGDCVLQPSEIRHRVLEAEAGSEVIEVTSPAVHETWFDYELRLPTNELLPEKVFSGQRFVRHIDADAEWKPSEIKGVSAAGTKIGVASSGRLSVRTLKSTSVSENMLDVEQNEDVRFVFIAGGRGIIVEIDSQQALIQ